MEKAIFARRNERKRHKIKDNETMKKTMMKAAAVVLLMMAASNASAQISLGNILGSVVNSATENTSAGDLISNLTSVFSSKKQASKKSIVGTWEYAEPAIVFQSDNLLAKAGSKMLANKLEKRLQEGLSKHGIKAGTLKYTFNEDGTFTQTLAGRTSTGKWSVSKQKLNLTYLGVKTFTITTQLESDKLMFVTDATKLLQLVKTISKYSGNSTLALASQLMGTVKGVQAGITLVKK